MTQNYKSTSGTTTKDAIVRSFENHESGQSYSQTLQKDDWDLHFGSKTAENASISDEQSVSGDQSLKVTYRSDNKDAAASSWGLPEADEYYLSYWVQFEDGFDFDGDDHSGGKLPGLASEGLASGGKDVTGENGFTARYMWREDGAAELYLYHMDQPGNFGESFVFEDENGDAIKFQPGEWHNLVQRVQVNDQGKANGEVDVWMDGVQVLDLDGLRFATDGSGVDRLYFSSFFGGNDAGWLPDRDVSAYFDDFVVSTNAADVGLDGATAGSPAPDLAPQDEPVAEVDPDPDQDTDVAVELAITSQWRDGFVVTGTVPAGAEGTVWRIQIETTEDIVNIWNAEVVAQDGDVYTIQGTVSRGQSQDGTAQFGFRAEGTDTNISLVDETVTPVQDPDVDDPVPQEPAPVSDPDETADVTFEVAKSWNDGFKGTFTITNDTDETIDDWVLSFDMAGFEVNKLWGGDVVVDGDTAFVSGNGRSVDIAPGATLEVGFTADGAVPLQLWDFDLG